MDLGSSHVLVDGQFVSAKIERMVQAIKDYDQDLNVEWVPPGARRDGQAAFKISYGAPGTVPYTLFYVQKDEDFDERVLARIIQNDQRVNGGTKLSDYEAWEAAQKVAANRARLDAIEEANDIAYHVLKTPLNTYRVNKDLVIKDGIPFNAKDM